MNTDSDEGEGNRRPPRQEKTMALYRWAKRRIGARRRAESRDDRARNRMGGSETPHRSFCHEDFAPARCTTSARADARY
jgi:hypothetical protein